MEGKTESSVYLGGLGCEEVGRDEVSFEREVGFAADQLTQQLRSYSQHKSERPMSVVCKYLFGGLWRLLGGAA